MYISDYIQTISSGLSFSHDLIEAHITDALQGDWEINRQLEDSTEVYALAFLNMVWLDNISISRRIESQDYTLSFRLMKKQTEFDNDSSQIDTNIITDLETKANEIKYKILESAEFSSVASNNGVIQVQNVLFRDAYDNITAGIQFTMNVKLDLGVTFCF